MNNLHPHSQNSLIKCYNNNSKLASEILKSFGYGSVDIIIDEKIHRFGSKNVYWYVCFDNWIVAGDWSNELSSVSRSISQEASSIISEEDRLLLNKKITESKQRAEDQRKKECEQTSVIAKKLWNDLDIQGKSAYLENKGLDPVSGIKFGNGFLATALIDNDDKVWTIQKIYDNNESKEVNKKMFIKGVKKKGVYSIFNYREYNYCDTIYIAEGLATALSILKAKPECLVVVSYGINSLDMVTKNIITRFPQKDIIIASDNDLCKNKNTGREVSEKVAMQHDLKITFPVFDDNTNGSDFNDLYLKKGLEHLIDQLNHAKRLAPKLKSYPIQEFLGKKLQKTKMIIDPILPQKGLMMIYAKRGVGKTFFASYLSCQVASGKDCFGGKWKVPEPLKVLYIDGEMPAETMQKRFSELSVKNCSTFDKNLSILSQDMQDCANIKSLGTEQGQKDLDHLIIDKDLIIIDNLSTLCSHGKENEASSWIPIQDWALRLRRLGKSIIFIHHAGKNSEQRGTSKKEDVLDTAISLQQKEDFQASNGANFQVHFEKARGFYGEDAQPFELQLVNNGGNEGLEWVVKEIKDLEMAKVLELSSAGMTQRDIASKIGTSPASVNRLLKKSKEVK